MALVIMFEPGMQRVDGITAGAALEACREIAADARDNTPVLTGAMRRSIRARKTKNGGRVYVGTDHWYFVEYGTDPHVILIRRHWLGVGPKVLVNKMYAGKKRFLGAMVLHPGVLAKMPIRKAFFQKRSMATLVIPDLPDNFTVGGGSTAREWYG